MTTTTTTTKARYTVRTAGDTYEVVDTRRKEAIHFYKTAKAANGKAEALNQAHDAAVATAKAKKADEATNAPTTEAPAKASSKAKKADETAAKANDTTKASKATSEAPTAPANEAPVSNGRRTFEVLQAGTKFEVCEVGTDKVIASFKSQAKAEAECERQNRAYLPASPAVAPEHKAAAADAIAAKLAEVNADTAAKAAAPKVDAPKRQRAAATGDWKGKAMSVLPAEGDTFEQLIAKRAEAVAKRDRIAAQAGTRSELHIKRGTALYNFRISQLDEALAAADKPLTPAEASKVVEFAASEPAKRRTGKKAGTK